MPIPLRMPAPIRRVLPLVLLLRVDTGLQAQTPTLGSQLGGGTTLLYHRDGTPQPLWTVDSIYTVATEFEGAQCIVAHIRRGPAPSREPDRLCLRADTLYRWSSPAGRWEVSRPVGADMTWRMRRANGDTVRYETGRVAQEAIGGVRVDVLPTVVTTVDSLGRPKARLRERYAVTLLTATGGTFDRPDSTDTSQWTPQSTFVLTALGDPRRQ